ncbi:MAG: hypothetical protein COB50_01910 [Thiotrichales bacterium]|nr:MAG: hypothetical protein COB50_01910 [Thiotrichales bacterium]
MVQSLHIGQSIDGMCEALRSKSAEQVAKIVDNIKQDAEQNPEQKTLETEEKESSPFTWENAGSTFEKIAVEDLLPTSNNQSILNINEGFVGAFNMHESSVLDFNDGEKDVLIGDMYSSCVYSNNTGGYRALGGGEVTRMGEELDDSGYYIGKSNLLFDDIRLTEHLQIDDGHMQCKWLTTSGIIDYNRLRMTFSESMSGSGSFNYYGEHSTLYFEGKNEDIQGDINADNLIYNIKNMQKIEVMDLLTKQNKFRNKNCRGSLLCITNKDIDIDRKIDRDCDIQLQAHKIDVNSEIHTRGLSLISEHDITINSKIDVTEDIYLNSKLGNILNNSNELLAKRDFVAVAKNGKFINLNGNLHAGRDVQILSGQIENNKEYKKIDSSNSNALNNKTLEAKITADGNIYLNATNGNVINTGNIEALHTLQILATEDIINRNTYHENYSYEQYWFGKILKTEKIVEAAIMSGNTTVLNAGNDVINIASLIKADRFLQINADNDVLNNCFEYSTQGQFDTIKHFMPGKILGGTGDEDTHGIGLDIHAKNKFINDGSEVIGFGNNQIRGDEGVESLWKSHTYISESWTRRNFWRTEHITKTSTIVQKPVIVSVNGKNVISSENGDIYSVATEFHGKKGTNLYAKNNIDLYNVKVTDRTWVCRSGWLSKSQRTEMHEKSVATVITGGGDANIISKTGSISLKGIRIIGDINLNMEAKENITISSDILNHSFEEHKSGFDFTETSVSYYDQQQSAHWQTLSGVISVSSLNIKAGNDVSFLNGIPIYVKNDETIYAKNTFTQRGIGLKSFYKFRREELTASGGLTGIGLSYGKNKYVEENINYVNQRNVVGSKATIRVGGHKLDSANLDAKEVDEKTNSLTSISRQDTHIGNSTSIEGGVTWSPSSASANISYSHSTEDSATINQISGIHSIKESNIVVANKTELKASNLTSDGKMNFKTRTLKTEQVIDHEKKDSVGVSVGIGVKDTITKGITSQKTSAQLGFSYNKEDKQVEHISTVFGKKGTKLQVEKTTGKINTKDEKGTKVIKDEKYGFEAQLNLQNIKKFAKDSSLISNKSAMDIAGSMSINGQKIGIQGHFDKDKVSITLTGKDKFLGEDVHVSTNLSSLDTKDDIKKSLNFYGNIGDLKFNYHNEESKRNDGTKTNKISLSQELSSDEIPFLHLGGKTQYSSETNEDKNGNKNSNSNTSFETEANSNLPEFGKFSGKFSTERKTYTNEKNETIEDTDTSFETEANSNLPGIGKLSGKFSSEHKTHTTEQNETVEDTDTSADAKVKIKRSGYELDVETKISQQNHKDIDGNKTEDSNRSFKEKSKFGTKNISVEQQEVYDEKSHKDANGDETKDMHSKSSETASLKESGLELKEQFTDEEIEHTDVNGNKTELNTDNLDVEAQYKDKDNKLQLYIHYDQTIDNLSKKTNLKFLEEVTTKIDKVKLRQKSVYNQQTQVIKIITKRKLVNEKQPLQQSKE